MLGFCADRIEEGYFTMSKERGKIRGFFFEFEGGDDALQEGLKNFGMALGRALTGPPRIPKALPNPNKNGKEESQDENATEVSDPETEDELLDASEENDNGRQKKQTSARKPEPMPSIVDLDHQGKKGVTLESFAKQKKPGSYFERALVIVYWLKNYGDLEEFGADHVFTCFKLLDWTPQPKNYRTMLRDMLNKQKSLDKGSIPGAYRININGENLVAKMGSAS